MAKAKGKELTGLQKAAILFITLGPEASSAIIKKLPDNDIQRITYEIANISALKPEVKKGVLEEFVQINKAKDYMVEGGLEYAKNILAKALGEDKAGEILEKVTEATEQYRPFSIARKADAVQLLNVISSEHPQTIALVLCYLQTDKAAQILSALPGELQEDVSLRIAKMSNSSPMVIKEIEKVLNGKLSSVLRSEVNIIGGVQTMVELINQVDRTTEKTIIDSLERQDPELAETIKASMFVFEDVVSLDDTSIQRILREVDGKDLALAVKGASEEVAECIFRNQSKRAAASLKEDIEFLGPVRLTDVEKAQQGIVAIIRRLEDAGEVVLSRGAEDAIIV